MAPSETRAFSGLLELASRCDLDALPSADLDEASLAFLAELRNLEACVKTISQAPNSLKPFDVQRLLAKLSRSDLGRNVACSENEKKESGVLLKEVNSCTPAKLGEYDILKVLGQGSSGTVYLASHRLLKRKVALKLLSDDADDVTAARFSREMEVIAALASPHIVAALDARVIDGQQLLVMEYITGQTLSQLVRTRGPRTIPIACELIQQVCVGLKTAHSAAVIHRDLKPANLILDETGLVKILDFGLASIRLSAAFDGEKPSSLTPSSNVMGTVDYISPEQIEDPRAADPRSDIYSLGCIFYLLLTGTPPFSAAEFPADVARLMAHLSIKPVPVSRRRDETPTGVDSVVARMLAKCPVDRFESVDQVADALAPFCQGKQND